MSMERGSGSVESSASASGRFSSKRLPATSLTLPVILAKRPRRLGLEGFVLGSTLLYSRGVSRTSGRDAMKALTATSISSSEVSRRGKNRTSLPCR